MERRENVDSRRNRRGLGRRMRRIGKKSMHKSMMMVNIFAPVIGKPSANEHNGIRGETT